MSLVQPYKEQVLNTMDFDWYKKVSTMNSDIQVLKDFSSMLWQTGSNIQAQFNGRRNRFVAVNPKLAAWLGKTPSELCNANLYDLVHTDYRQRVSELLQNPMQESQIHDPIIIGYYRNPDSFYYEKHGPIAYIAWLGFVYRPTSTLSCGVTVDNPADFWMEYKEQEQYE